MLAKFGNNLLWGGNFASCMRYGLNFVKCTLIITKHVLKLVWCDVTTTSSLKMLQVSKHIFALSIKLLSPGDGDSLEYHKVQRSFNLKLARCQQWRCHSLPQVMIFLTEPVMTRWYLKVHLYSVVQGCMNTHLWIELMPAKHTISFILVDCKQPVGSL